MKLLDLVTGHVSKDEFAKRMVQAFKSRGYQTPKYDAEQFSIDLGDQPSGGVMFLAHFYAEFCQSPRRDRKAMPARFADIRIKGMDDANAISPDATKLLPVIRDSSYAWFCAAQVAAILSDVKLNLSGLEIGDNHRASLVLDSPTQMQGVTDQVLTSLNLTFEEGFSQAMQNLRDMSPDKWHSIGANAYVGAWDDSFDCSRILLTDLIYRLDLPSNPVALIPARGVLLVTSSASVEGQLNIFVAAKEIIEKNSRWTSASLMELKDGTWQTYVPSEPSVLQLQGHLFARFQYGTYEQQKQILDRQLKAQDKDIFVATFMAYEKNQKAFSVATWTDGVEAWLPKTQYLMLLALDAKDDKDMVIVTWEVAFKFLGDYMQQVPDILPVRFHVNSFPNSELLRVLREHQTVMGE